VTTTTTTVGVTPTSNTQSVPPIYAINESFLPNPSNYFISLLQNSTLQETLAPQGITGFKASYFVEVSNKTAVKTDNVPIYAFSIIVIFNSTASAVQEYDYLNNITIRQHTYSGLNVSTFQTPRIGNLTTGYVVFPEDTNQKAFLINLQYKNFAARLGVFETLNSSSTAAIINLAQKVFSNLQRA